MAKQNNATIGFEKQIWDAACVLWGHIPAAEYRKVIVGLIFLRYISSAFEKRYQELVAEGDGFEDDRDAYAEDNIFFVPEEARWSKISSSAHTPEIGTVIDDAMRAIEKENTTLKNVLPKNYASPDLDKRVLGDVVDLFTNMDMGDTEESKDLLGRTYEYCIAQVCRLRRRQRRRVLYALQHCENHRGHFETVCELPRLRPLLRLRRYVRAERKIHSSAQRQPRRDFGLRAGVQRRYVENG